MNNNHSNTLKGILLIPWKLFMSPHLFAVAIAVMLWFEICYDWLLPHYAFAGFAVAIGLLFYSAVHEIGHAIAASLCGFDVNEIRIGLDQGSFRPFSFFNFKVSFPPLGGYVWEDTKGKHTPCKIRAYALGGPGTNAIVGLLCLLFRNYSEYGHVSIFFFWFFTAQFAGCLNLIPFKFSWKDCAYWSDGMAFKCPLPWYAHITQKRSLIKAASAVHDMNRW